MTGAQPLGPITAAVRRIIMIGYVFTWVLFFFAVTIGWFAPFWSLMVYFAFSILRPVHLWFWSFDPSTRLAFYVGAVTIIGWIISGFGDRTKLRGAKLPVFGIVVYLAMGLYGWLITTRQPGYQPFRAELAFMLQLKIMMMGVIALTMVRSARQIRIFTIVILVAISYLSWVFNYQNTFEGWNRVLSRGFAGIDNNGVGMIMVIGVPLAFFVGVHNHRWWVKVICWFFAILLINQTLNTYSRGAQLALIVVGCAIFFFAMTRLPNKALTLGLAIVMVCATMYLAGPMVRHEFSSIFLDPEKRDASANSRFTLWSAAWECMKDNPMGVAPGHWKLAGHLYGTQGRAAHNLYLQTGAEYGFIGLGGFVLFLAGSLWQCFRTSQSKVAIKLGWPAHYATMCAIALSGYMVCGLFISFEALEEGYIVAFLGLTIACYVDRIAASGAMPDEVIPELEQVPEPVDEEMHDPWAPSPNVQKPEYVYA